MKFNVTNTIKLFKSNAFALWYSSLLVSLLIFSIYFIEIKYFPIKSYDSLIALSLFVSVVLVLIILILTIPLFFSSILQKRLIKNEQACSFLFGSKFQKLFNRIGQKEVKRKAEIKIAIIPIKKIIFLHIVNMLFLLIAFNFMPVIAMLISMIFPLISIFILATDSNKPLKSPYSKITLIFSITSIITTSNLLILISAALLDQLQGITAERGINYIIHTITTYLCLLAYSSFTLFPLPDIKNKLQKPVILTLVVVLLLTINGSIIRLPKLIIETFRIGNICDATLSTDKKGCYLFKNNGLNIDCDDKDLVFLIPNINILWRLDEYVISYQDLNGDFRQIILNPAITKIYDIDSTG